ncbi:hypothetical protein Poly24_35060 [Rosistilla carotiformis]|uniref:Uncharacterized protein n=1 Tax=Rosistilla carotiformis TaxID=2528017 RepID=A0A518JW73_9BACT|nr:hypothetical protein [Rosistilla carotiformis]QDV69789.1 hypothetical protein Poly24_35060 [Rosistilla carotiformis]
MENVESDGLLPRFTLRWFSILFTLSVLVAWIFRQSVLGSQWASAAMVTLAVMAGMFAIYAVLFMLIWAPNALANLGNASGKQAAERSTRDDAEADA